MQQTLASICVYCGSASGSRPEYTAAAVNMGQVIAGAGLRLVYGGGHVGLMGTIADAALTAGGAVTGVIPTMLMQRELGHGSVTELIEVRDMHERKMTMANRADGFIAMPGGYGTLEELAEMLTWHQLSLHAKPIGLLNVAGYFDAFLVWIDHMVTEGFLKPQHRALIQVDADPATLLQKLRNFHVSDVPGVGEEPA